MEMCTGRRDFGEYTGKISVDGTDLENLSSKDLRNMGYVRQFENHPRSKRMVLNLRRLRASDQHTAASSGCSLRGSEECGLVSSLIKSR